MEEDHLISDLDIRQEELCKALVNGGNDLAEDNKIRGRILGLEEAKSIIHEAYIRFNNGNDQFEN